MKYLTRTVWIVSFVSLFNDIASEMLYPILPIYLQSVGFSVLFIGILEGFAEAIAGIGKGYFGKLSDRLGKRAGFIQAGYVLSAISKPMFVIATFKAWIFTARSLDKVGKGLRTAARDAILSDECTKENKAKVFGFHQGMDTTGAVIGPLLAILYLYYYPGDYKTMFLLAIIPGLVTVLLTLFLKDRADVKPTVVGSGSFFRSFDYWKRSSLAYKELVTGLLLFQFFNSSDMFLLLKAKGTGIDDKMIILLMVLYNLVGAVAAFPLGHLADRVGLKKVLLAGIVLFAIVYAGMGLNASLIGFICLFMLYGIYIAATQGVSKALITNNCPKEDLGAALGTFAGLSSLVAMLSSSFAGLVWYKVSPDFMFMMSAGGALAVVFYFGLFNKQFAD